MTIIEVPGKIFSVTKYHLRILWALLIRELATRYGRDNIGILWIVGEPLIFTFGVVIMYSFIRPKYDHGIYLVPFVVTGYLPLTLLRHSIGQGLMCLTANNNLLYHRRIAPLHLFVSRLFMEFVGCSLAFIFVVCFFCLLGYMNPPKSIGLIYLGWFMYDWLIFGFVLFMASICVVFDVFEKFANLITYVMIPLSGTFWMIFFLPYQYRSMAMKLPLVDCEEMIRSGFLGETIHPYYSVAYTAGFAAVLSFSGLLMLKIVRPKIALLD
jgi:capsular polysaccharide transport system permease protein